ncbi:MAG TPA: DUF4349 domain-containing protein [Flavobacteriia bacterium]|nr:DUF4349 domain-containing protein [Flavobacteriia bacterium]
MSTNKLNQPIKIALLLVIGFLSSCNSKNYKSRVPVENVGVSTMYEAVESDGAEMSTPDEQKKVSPQDVKIIKSASVRYKVMDVKEASRQIQKITGSLRGYISDQRFQNSTYQTENRFTIKIPQESFAVLMDSLGKVAEFIDYENISSRDVTEEYVDLESRLKTKLAVKQRYEIILRQHAKTVKDILATEEKLGVIQEEIEAAQGRLQYLTNKVSYSTVQVDLYETVAYKETPESYTRTFFSKAKEGLVFGWQLIESIVLGIIYVWPLLLIGLVLFFVLRAKFKK